MATYYVHIPDSETPTAEVDASSTKHARTAYLDYLSRSGLIAWQQRQATRSLVKVNRMQPGEIQTQVKLEYGVKEPPVQEIEVPEELEEEVEEAGWVGSGGISGPDEEDVIHRTTYTPEGEPRETTVHRLTPRPKLSPIGDSPIARMSKKSMGM